MLRLSWEKSTLEKIKTINIHFEKERAILNNNNSKNTFYNSLFLLVSVIDPYEHIIIKTTILKYYLRHYDWNQIQSEWLLNFTLDLHYKHAIKYITLVLIKTRLFKYKCNCILCKVNLC